jgi:exodeoxyribonuclease V alpha subunit
MLYPGQKTTTGPQAAGLGISSRNQNKMAELTGQIEHITFFNEDSGYTVARVKVHGQWDLVTVVGNMMSPSPGEILKMKGDWSSHPRFGEQFKVRTYQTTVPATVYGIKKYLGSGLIKGLGPKMANRIVDQFGKKTLDIIEHQTQRLAEINGIGKKRIAMIQQAWSEQKDVRNVMLFLQSHGVSSGYATKIFKQYKDRSIAVVKQNPFRLAMDIAGIGFIIADRIAEKLGFPKNSEVRAEAGIIYVLHNLSEEGHVLYPYGLLIQKCVDMLEVDRSLIIHAMDGLSQSKKIIIENLPEGIQASRTENKVVYLAKFHLCETSIALKIRKLLNTPLGIPAMDTRSAIAWVQTILDISLAEAQISAVTSALENKMMIITGGPGTGKTTIINAILKIVDKRGLKTLLAAPTGRAAKRMSEATGHDAQTIHRLLEYSMQHGGFQRNETNPLACDMLIIDEASMIDTILMHYLLKAVPVLTTLILVGDVNQLPSVGPGNVLNDIITSDIVPVVVLTEIFRQAKESRIITNAHRINAGLYPSVDPPVNALDETDFYFIEQQDPERVLHIIIELATKRIPIRFGLDAIDDIQVLTPMHKGIVGAGNLNIELQQALNPREDSIIRGNNAFRVDDKVMQVKNNYDKSVFNGDIGRIKRIDTFNQEVVVNLDGRDIVYDFSELDEITLAYAISVHKSQGSEYAAVVVPILTQHFVLLQRNLIYTAVTRGKRLVVVVGTRKALTMGIKNNKTTQRYTNLRQRIKSQGDLI